MLVITCPDNKTISTINMVSSIIIKC